MIDRQRIAKLNNPFAILSLSILATIAIILAFTPLPKKNQPVATHIVNVKESSEAEQRATNKNKKQTKSYAVSVKSIGNEIIDSSSNVKAADKYYQGGGNKIDCGKAKTFSDLVACESLNTQNSVDESTVSIKNWTIFSGLFALLAFVVGAFSIYLLWKANRIARKSLEVSNRAYLDLGESILAVEKDPIVKVSIPIKNYGATPAMEVQHAIISGLIDWDYRKVNRDITFDECLDRFTSMNSISGGATSSHVVTAFNIKEGDDRQCFVSIIVKYKSVFGDTHIYTGYWETTKINLESRISLRSCDPPQQVERKIQDLIQRRRSLSY